MATPKYKTSKAKAASRKAANMKLSETLFLHTASALSAVTTLVSR